VTQLIHVIAGLRECRHGCGAMCSHSNTFEKVTHLLDPTIQRRIRDG